MKILFWRKDKPAAPPTAPTGPYVGRLAFDSDLECHVDPNGFEVITPDGGKTWRYREQGDPTHQQQYHKNVAGVAMTTPEDPHHEFPFSHDPHYSEGAVDPETGKLTHTRVINSPDSLAAVETSHTEAYNV